MRNGESSNGSKADRRSMFTIGHSNHPMEVFLGLLAQHGITCLVDVRSSPYSRFSPHFKKDALSESLKSANIFYLFMGGSLGARQADPTLLFEDGVVDFAKIRAAEKFQQGLTRVEQGLEKGHRIALMCAEKDPFDCHRFILISPELVKRGIRVRHILASGALVENRALEDRLLGKYGFDSGQGDLFTPPMSRDEALAVAYGKRNREIGFSAARRK